MASDIPTPQGMAISLLLQLASSGLSAILNAFHKKSAADAVAAADQTAVAILQQTAAIKGLTIDWTDPQAVLTYIQSLPTFVPIPEPTSTTQDPPPAAKS